MEETWQECPLTTSWNGPGFIVGRVWPRQRGRWPAVQQSVSHQRMSVDYFGTYFTPDGFDFPRLIDDDFIAPIRLLYQNGHYVSAAKLLMIFVDSIGYVEYGDAEPVPFIKWLTTYAKLDEVRVTPAELWEHRNSLLHMSNLDSRKVVAGKVKRLMLYVGVLPASTPPESIEAKYYNLQKLIVAVVSGCERWFSTYNADRAKIESFVKRYDLIASDNRMLKIDLSERVDG